MGLSVLRRAGCLALFALASACAAPPPPPPPPASATSTIDGTYKGGASGSCGSSQATVILHDRRFTLTVADGLALQGTAESDGTLRAATSGDGGRDLNFTGRVAGAYLRGGSYNGRCAFAFALTRQS